MGDVRNTVTRIFSHVCTIDTCNKKIDPVLSQDVWMLGPSLSFSLPLSIRLYRTRLSGTVSIQYESYSIDMQLPLSISNSSEELPPRVVHYVSDFW